MAGWGLPPPPPIFFCERGGWLIDLSMTVGWLPTPLVCCSVLPAIKRVLLYCIVVLLGGGCGCLGLGETKRIGELSLN